MDCLSTKYNSERTTKSTLKKKFFLQTTQFVNLRAQASEADYYIVIIHLTGEKVQQSHR